VVYFLSGVWSTFWAARPPVTIEVIQSQKPTFEQAQAEQNVANALSSL